MKTKIFLIACLASSLALPAQGQFVRGVGIKLGGVIANQKWDYTLPVTIPKEGRWGLDAGFYVEVLDLSYLSLLGELHYVQKGFESTITVTTEDNPEGAGEKTLAPRVDYLCLPLLVKFRLELGAVSPYVIAGPRFDFLLDHTDEGFGPVLDKFKKTETGADIALGLEIPANVVAAFLAEIRYSPSFTKAFDSGVLTVKNESLELLIGVRF